MPAAGREVGARCAGVSRAYGAASGTVPALVGVDAEFPPGALTVLAGPSGSGKSSLLRVVACQDRPDAGEVWIRGVEVTRLGAHRRRLVRRREIGFVFQQPVENLVDYLTASEHVEWALRLRGAKGTRGAAAELLDSVGLGPRSGHLPAMLSGGEQQRLGVACALAGQPGLVVADEPTAQLDAAAADLVIAALLAARTESTAVVVSSHDPALVAEADHVVRLLHGRREPAA
jgi:putative ABC transport system ATP-binding protein